MINCSSLKHTSHWVSLAICKLINYVGVWYLPLVLTSSGSSVGGNSCQQKQSMHDQFEVMPLDAPYFSTPMLLFPQLWLITLRLETVQPWSCTNVEIV